MFNPSMEKVTPLLTTPNKLPIPFRTFPFVLSSLKADTRIYFNNISFDNSSIEDTPYNDIYAWLRLSSLSFPLSILSISPFRQFSYKCVFPLPQAPVIITAYFALSLFMYFVTISRISSFFILIISIFIY